MHNNQYDYYPHSQGNIAPKSTQQNPKKSYSLGFLLSVVCIVAAISILLTYTLTSAANRSYYSAELESQQKVIDQLREVSESSGVAFDKLEMMASIFDRYSYYAGSVSEEELLTAVLKAYAEATGDLYAEYYTDEEYAALTTENQGDYVGIGVSVIQTRLTVSGTEYQVFQVIAIYEDAPAASSELQIGDFIYAIKDGEAYQTVNALGYTKAISMIQGEKGTLAEFAAFRKDGEDYRTVEFGIVRDSFESRSVSHFLSNSDPSIGVVRISNFDLTTPVQLKQSVQALLASGVEHFVFDLRNNPGGDLQSIKAVLSYFLQEGDLILSAIDKNGTVARSYYAEVMNYAGDYASCNVAKKEIGMFADLDMVVLCNENTASAAEVFTATMRDYGLAKTVGKTTYGKGIMQSFLSLSMFGNYTGYVKMTTYAYVTKCGVTYHEIGIIPDVQVSLSEEALQYNFHVLPQEKDDQLLSAFALFH